MKSFPVASSNPIENIMDKIGLKGKLYRFKDEYRCKNP